MTRYKFIFIALCVAWLPTAGFAEEVCGNRDDFIQQLSAQYSEVLTARGLANNGIVWEVLTSPSGTWTIILTNPMGVTCPIGAGESWAKTPAVSTAGRGPEM